MFKTSDEPGPRPKREAFASAAAFVAATERFFEIVESQQRFSAICKEDGSFRLPDVPAGTYQLSIKARDFKKSSPAPSEAGDPTPVVATLVREIVVPDGQAGKPVDLGVLELAVQRDVPSVQ